MFFREVLNNLSPTPETDGQERLLKVNIWIRQRVLAMRNEGGQTRIQQWLRGISELQVLEFIESNEGKAIRMFQSVNDRGVPLGKMDIAKSLLVYFSNRYLQGGLDEHVAESFGSAFRSFNRIKRLAKKADGYQVRHIDRETFSEDDVLRYHYFAFDDAVFGGKAGADYNATAQQVLDYLKRELKRLCGSPDALQAFISAYTDDLTSFFVGLEALLEATRTG